MFPPEVQRFAHILPPWRCMATGQIRTGNSENDPMIRFLATPFRTAHHGKPADWGTVALAATRAEGQCGGNGRLNIRQGGGRNRWRRIIDRWDHRWRFTAVARTAPIAATLFSAGRQTHVNGRNFRQCFHFLIQKRSLYCFGEPPV